VTVVRLAEERPAYYGKAITDRLHRLTRIAICYAEGEIKENSNKAHFSPTARPSLGRCPHARKEFDMNTLKFPSANRKLIHDTDRSAYEDAMSEGWPAPLQAMKRENPDPDKESLLTREWFTPVWVVPSALFALAMFYALLR
jgi:hypothetical protein